MPSSHLPRFAPPALTMHRSCARECNRAGAESWPASKSIKTRCPIDANRPPGWLRTQLAVLRQAPPVCRPIPEPMSLEPLPVLRLSRLPPLQCRAFLLRPPRLNPPPHPKPLATAASAASGEKFAERIITDTEHSGMRAATIHLPEKWSFDSKIEWHYNWIEYPHFLFRSRRES